VTDALALDDPSVTDNLVEVVQLRECEGMTIE